MKAIVIIPAYNEEENIGKLLRRLKEITDIELDVVVINDNSVDNTSKICAQYNVEIIDLPCNLGIGGAVQTGYKFAQINNYDFAIQVDGDGQHNPEYISEMLYNLIDGKADMIIGSRFLKKEGFQSSSARRIGIKYFSNLISLLSGQKITDPTSGFRACNKKVIKLFTRRYPQDYPEPESIIFLNRQKLKIMEIPVIMREREGGESSINLLKSVYYMIKVSLAIIIDHFRKQTV